MRQDTEHGTKGGNDASCCHRHLDINKPTIYCISHFDVDRQSSVGWGVECRGHRISNQSGAVSPWSLNPGINLLYQNYDVYVCCVYVCGNVDENRDGIASEQHSYHTRAPFDEMRDNE